MSHVLETQSFGPFHLQQVGSFPLYLCLISLKLQESPSGSLLMSQLTSGGNIVSSIHSLNIPIKNQLLEFSHQGTSQLNFAPNQGQGNQCRTPGIKCQIPFEDPKNAEKVPRES